MKVLVTGGAGFVGSNFIHYILHKYPDWQVRRLIEDPIFAKTLGDNAFNFVKTNLSWEATTREVESIFKKFVGR